MPFWAIIRYLSDGGNWIFIKIGKEGNLRSGISSHSFVMAIGITMSLAGKVMQWMIDLRVFFRSVCVLMDFENRQAAVKF